MLYQSYFGSGGVASRRNAAVGLEGANFRSRAERFRRRGEERARIVQNLERHGYHQDGACVVDVDQVREGKRWDSAPDLPDHGRSMIRFEPPADETRFEALHRVAREAQLHRDAMRWSRAPKRNDSLSPMASEALTYFYERVYQIEHRDLMFWSGQILAVDRRPDPAAREIVWYERDRVGTAKAGTQYSPSSIPLVAPPVMNPNAMRVVPALCGWETNFMEGRYEALSRANGKPTINLEDEKIDTCTRVIGEFGNALWAYGDSQLQIGGWLNDARVEVLPIAGGVWAGKTGVQISNDLSLIFNAIRNFSFGRLNDYSNLTLYLPPAQFQRANNEIVNPGSESALRYTLRNLREAGKNVKAVKELDELAVANSFAFDGGPPELREDTAVLVYEEGDLDKDPVFVLPQDIEIPSAPIDTGVGEISFMHARISGMRLPDAQKMLYIKGI